MIELLAVAHADGWALIRIDGATFVVRPPYRDWAKIRVSEHTVEIAVVSYGFVREEGEFHDYVSLFRHLWTLRAAAHKGPEPDSKRIRDILRMVPPEIAERHLTRIEEELLPAGDRNAAWEALSRLLTSAAVKGNAHLLDRATALLAELGPPPVSDVDKKYLEAEATVFAVEFPRVTLRYGASVIIELAETLKTRCRMLALGGI